MGKASIQLHCKGKCGWGNWAFIQHLGVEWQCRKEERGRQPRGPGMGDFHSAASPPGPGKRWCERECRCLTQHVPKPQKRSDVCKKQVACSYLIRGISRSFLHCLDRKEVLCPCISLSLSGAFLQAITVLLQPLTQDRSL